jgi:hypothetical protein
MSRQLALDPETNAQGACRPSGQLSQKSSRTIRHHSSQSRQPSRFWCPVAGCLHSNLLKANSWTSFPYENTSTTISLGFSPELFQRTSLQQTCLPAAACSRTDSTPTIMALLQATAALPGLRDYHTPNATNPPNDGTWNPNPREGSKEARSQTASLAVIIIVEKKRALDHCLSSSLAQCINTIFRFFQNPTFHQEKP